MSKRAVGGYAFNYEVARARNAARKAREALRKLLDDRPGPQTSAMLIASATLALAEAEEALSTIDQIARLNPEKSTAAQ